MSAELWEAVNILRLLLALLGIGGGILCVRDYHRGQGKAKWLAVICYTLAAVAFISLALEWLFKP